MLTRCQTIAGWCILGNNNMPEKQWDAKYRDSGKQKETTRLFEQKHHCIVHRDGVEIDLYGTKRDYPKDRKCELCGAEGKNKRRIDPLDYHHWDDKNISKGMWLCQKCHRRVEGWEIFCRNFWFTIRYNFLKPFKGGF